MANLGKTLRARLAGPSLDPLVISALYVLLVLGAPLIPVFDNVYRIVDDVVLDYTYRNLDSRRREGGTAVIVVAEQTEALGRPRAMERVLAALTAAGATATGVDLSAQIVIGPANRAALLTLARRDPSLVVAIRLDPPAERNGLVPAGPITPQTRDWMGVANLFLGITVAERVANEGRHVRLLPVTVPTTSGPAFAFSLLLARRHLRLPATNAQSDRCVLGQRSVPLEAGLLRVRPRRSNYFRRIKLEDLLKKPQSLSGHIVLLTGPSDGDGEAQRTALGEISAAVAHASAVESLLSGEVLQRLPRYYSYLLFVLLSISIHLAYQYLPRITGLTLSLLTPVAAALLCYSAARHGAWLPCWGTLFFGPLHAIGLWGLATTGPSFGGVTPLPAGSQNMPGDVLFRAAHSLLQDRYDDLAPLSAGGMGLVLSARMRGSGKPVAVKILSPLLAGNPELTRRFDREIAALRSHPHPGLPEIEEVDLSGACPHYAMELLVGKDLRAVLDEGGPLSLKRARHIFSQLFQVLDFIHRCGLIHRDLKPQNIFVQKNDQVKLLDFGVAHISYMTTLTGTGALLGTPRYFSPEQLDGVEPDPHSDDFGAALVAYEALTGHLPYPTVGAILNFSAPPTPASRHRPDIPPAVDVLLSQCLAKNPHDRPATTAAILEAWNGAFRTGE
jgi:CHASE2 domain-containing sensor protein